MNEFASLLAGQVRADLRTLPRRAQRHFSAAGQAARAGSIGELRDAARRGPSSTTSTARRGTR